MLTALVHSSRIAKRGLWQKSLAIAILCFSPPDSTSAQSLTESKPPSRSSMQSSLTQRSNSLMWSSLRPFLCMVCLDWGQMTWSLRVPGGRQGLCGTQNSLSMLGRSRIPPLSGQSPLKILKSELFPHPLGPVTTVLTPLLTSKDTSFTKTSPLGEATGTLVNLMQSSVSMRVPLIMSLTWSSLSSLLSLPMI